jgi:hypothetical protein
MGGRTGKGGADTGGRDQGEKKGERKTKKNANTTNAFKKG